MLGGAVLCVKGCRYAEGGCVCVNARRVGVEHVCVSWQRIKPEKSCAGQITPACTKGAWTHFVLKQ